MTPTSTRTAAEQSFLLFATERGIATKLRPASQFALLANQPAIQQESPPPPTDEDLRHDMRQDEMWREVAHKELTDRIVENGYLCEEDQSFYDELCAEFGNDEPVQWERHIC